MFKGDHMKHISELGLVDYIVAGISIFFSGVGSYVRRDLSGFTIKRKLKLLLIDIIGSSSIGITMFFVVYGWTENLALSAGIASAFGHIGTRGIYLMELLIAEKLKSDSMKNAVEDYYRRKK